MWKVLTCGRLEGLVEEDNLWFSADGAFSTIGKRDGQPDDDTKTDTALQLSRRCREKVEVCSAAMAWG